MAPAGWRIGELAVRARVSADTIRYYERLGLLPPAHRAENGYRRYQASAVQRLLAIRNARRCGMVVSSPIWRGKLSSRPRRARVISP